MSTFKTMAELARPAKIARGPAKGAYPQIITQSPKMTIPGYRAHRIFDSGPRAGELYPVMIGKENAETALSQQIPMGEWLKSQVIPFGMAPRQGWHAGELPYGPQFNVGGKDPGSRFGRLQPDDVIYSRVALGADNNVSGYVSPTNRGIIFDEKIKLPFDQTQLPEGGFYTYRPSGYESPWLVSDKVRHESLLTDEEIADIFRTAGKEPPPPRASKPVTEARLKELGLLNLGAGAAVVGGMAVPGESEAGIGGILAKTADLASLQKATAAPVRGEMRAAPRGGLLGALADLLGGAKGFFNAPGKVPYLNQGVGDLLMGQAPELADSMSYGFSPVRGAGMAATLDPAVIDLMALMAPAAGRAAGVARNLPGVVRRAALDAYGPAVNMAERSRWGLGGQEVPKDAMLGEFGLAPPPVLTPKRVRNTTPKPKSMEERNAMNRELVLTGGYGIGGNRMSADDMLRLIQEFGKTLPNTPQPVVPNPWK